MNLKGFSILFLVAFFISSVFSSSAQDILITKKGQDIPAKVLEISLTTIKYKRFDNINGPIYNIPKEDVLMIRYQNGTKEMLNGGLTKNENQITPKQSLIKEEKVKTEVSHGEILQNEQKAPIVEPLPKALEEPIKSELPTIAEKSKIPNHEFSDEYLKFNNKKLVWGIGALLTTGVGIFSIFQSNNLYNQYKTATTQANSIHGQIETLDIVSPIAFALAGFSAIEFFIQHSKQKKVVKFKVIPDKNAVSGIRLGLNYTF